MHSWIKATTEFLLCWPPLYQQFYSHKDTSHLHTSLVHPHNYRVAPVYAWNYQFL